MREKIVRTGLLEPGVAEGAMVLSILSDQLTLSQPREQIMPVTTCSPGFSDLPTTLKSNVAITGLNTELCKW